MTRSHKPETKSQLAILKTLGSLSNGVFKRRRSVGSGLFASLAVADPDLQIRGGGGLGAGSHPDPEIREGTVSPKIFFGPLDLIFISK